MKVAVLGIDLGKNSSSMVGLDDSRLLLLGTERKQRPPATR
jgi:hypothetical protein